MRTVLGTVMAAALVAVLPSAAAAQEAVLAYQRAIAQVCQKKVTAEMARLPGGAQGDADYPLRAGPGLQLLRVTLA